MTRIPVQRQTVNMQTGQVTETATSHMTLIPCDTSKGQCEQCAVKHEPGDPHDAQSIYYQYWFYGKHSFWPNWGNAMAHCDDATRRRWQAELVLRGVTADKLIPKKETPAN